MDFTKMTGAGNDFIILAKTADLALDPASIRLLCDRRYGIGADGLMIISKQVGRESEEAHRESSPAFSVEFYNADGSGGMLCGNGARCSLVYAANQGFISFGRLSAFRFAGNLYSGLALSSDRAHFRLDPHYATRMEKDIKIGSIAASGRYLDLGSLHLVVDIADIEASPIDRAGSKISASLDKIDVATLGQALRNHQRFAPMGVNVNFCSLEKGKLRVRTFERGVEAETLACGTGSTASALSYALRGLVKPPVHVITKSGEELIIDFDQAEQASRLSLEGPARIVFQGRLESAYLNPEG